jgi:putative membrane protein
LNLVVHSHTVEQHFLRDERGVYYEDLYPLIAFLPRYANGQAGGPNDPKLPLWDDMDDYNRPIDMPATELGRDGQNSEDSLRKRDVEKEAKVPDEHPLKPARMPPSQTLYDYIPLFRFFRWIARSVSKRARAKQLAAGRKPKRKIYEDVVESYIPLEILLFLSR